MVNTLVHGGARTKAIGVIVPVHDEEDLLGHALEAIDQAFFRVGGQGIACRSAIILDDCSDSSATIAQRWVDALRRRGGEHQAMVVRSHSASVGRARRTGSDALLRAWADTDLRHIWLATTDADSRVPSDWLLTQLNAHECGTELWTGRVVVDDWSLYQQSTARRWSEAYDNEDAPIHGANLGFNAQVYVDAGGFTARATGEDRALYHAIVARGGRTHYDSVAKVVTSGRRQGRAPMGFSFALTSVEADMQAEEMNA
jgi:glycosyltransferase involved in cell wall biosynthesis